MPTHSTQAPHAARDRRTVRQWTVLVPLATVIVVAGLTGAGLAVDHFDEDHPPITSTPSYTEDAGAGEWPYELRFYDPPAEGVKVTLRLPVGQALRVGPSDYTVGLEKIPGFTEPPPSVDGSTLHGSGLVVGRVYQL